MPTAKDMNRARNVLALLLFVVVAMLTVGCEGTLEGDFANELVSDSYSVEEEYAKDDAPDGEVEASDEDPTRFDPVRDLRPGGETEAEEADEADEPAPEETPAEVEEPSTAPGTIVDFHIEPGTGNGSWNTRDTAVTVYVGQILRVYNDDDQVHQIHSGDSGPFPHGQQIQPGAFATYEVVRPMALGDSNTLYDHGVGRAAAFWIEANPQ